MIILKIPLNSFLIFFTAQIDMVEKQPQRFHIFNSALLIFNIILPPLRFLRFRPLNNKIFEGRRWRYRTFPISTIQFFPLQQLHSFFDRIFSFFLNGLIISMIIYTILVIFIGHYLFSKPQSEFSNHSLPLVFLVITPHYLLVLFVGLFRIAGLYKVQQGSTEGDIQKLLNHCSIFQHQQQLPSPLGSIQLFVYLLPSCYYEILEATFADILLAYTVHLQQSEEVPIPISIVFVVLPQQSQ